MLSYLWVVSEHVVPQDGGPRVGHLADIRDDYHRQGMSLQNGGNVFQYVYSIFFSFKRFDYSLPTFTDTMISKYSYFYFSILPHNATSSGHTLIMTALTPRGHAAVL